MIAEINGLSHLLGALILTLAFIITGVKLFKEDTPNFATTITIYLLSWLVLAEIIKKSI